MPDDQPDTGRQVQFTRHFAECERALQAFAYSLVPVRADADDIVQEALAALWKNFDDYDPERPFLPWANRFVYRQVQMHRRSQATRSKYFFSDQTIEQLAAEQPVSLERDQAVSRALEKCLDRLSAKHREHQSQVPQFKEPRFFHYQGEGGMNRIRVGSLIVSFSLLCCQFSPAEGLENFNSDKLRPIVEGHDFTEGPTLDGQGNVLFTSPKQNSIVRYSIDDQSSSVFYQGEDPVSALFFRGSRLFATQGTLKRIIAINSPSEFVTLADSYNGSPFNKPNDLWVSPRGHVYFTDPNYGRNPMSQDGEFAYLITKDGKVSRIEAEFSRPNGIVGTEDGKSLFITDAGDSRTYQFDLDENGEPGKQILFTEIGGDGMTLDKRGNLYIAVPRQKALVVINPSGKEIARISDFGCTNVCFGPQGNTLYITRAPGLWALDIY